MDTLHLAWHLIIMLINVFVLLCFLTGRSSRYGYVFTVFACAYIVSRSWSSVRSLQTHILGGSIHWIR